MMLSSQIKDGMTMKNLYLFLLMFGLLVCGLLFQRSSSHQRITRQPQLPSRILGATMIGGLGNHLWIYSSLYGIAKKSNRTPVACIGYDIRTIFSNLSIPIYNQTLCKRGEVLQPNSSRHIGQRHHHLHYDTDLIPTLRESQNPFAFICCYLQNLRYFFEYLDDLKAQFVIKQSLQSKAQEYLRTLSKKIADQSNQTFAVNGKGQVLIGGTLPIFVTVHVRRGNMLGEKTVIQPEPAYFSNATSYFRKKYGKAVIFSVATDDTAWCIANVTGSDVYLTSETGAKSREDEFAIAVACNHTVMSVGTYGWWMGFLAGGDVIYLKDWAKGDWIKWLKQEEFFLKKWIPM